MRFIKIRCLRRQFKSIFSESAEGDINCERGGVKASDFWLRIPEPVAGGRSLEAQRSFALFQYLSISVSDISPIFLPSFLDSDSRY